MKKSSVIRYESGGLEISFSPETQQYSLPRTDFSQDTLEALVRFTIEVMNDVTGSDFSSLTSEIIKPPQKSTVPPRFNPNPAGMNIDLWSTD